ncbi:hypothetical protein GCM10010399_61070 [Dactylosporangium fulvum]|uniref:Lipoprotein n=1 Tax=Dactylosporangium fulvum TaxID=53359 RepID=A0ABY5W1D8_9ACTN|nr:hypothetical protein [Dactylosporangium fulvum]UWP83274.1 hypothetical protein Dfulv_02925 [Dactylosporangium fulvum]
MDRTGRRRRLFTGLGAGLGVLLAGGCSLLIAGLLGSSPVPLPGLPESGQGGLYRGETGVSPAPSRLVPAQVPNTRTPAPSATQPAATTPATAVPVPTDLPGNRKTSHPGNGGNPKPSRTK